MPRSKSACASALHDVTKGTEPSCASKACALTALPFVDNASAATTHNDDIRLIALLLWLENNSRLFCSRSNEDISHSSLGTNRASALGQERKFYRSAAVV